jgi:hypothetical protein
LRVDGEKEGAMKRFEVEVLLRRAEGAHLTARDLLQRSRERRSQRMEERIEREEAALRVRRRTEWVSTSRPKT